MNLHPKVAAAGIAGAVVTITVWALALVHITMPSEVAGSLVLVLMSAAGWFKAGPDVQGLVDAAYKAGRSRGKRAKPTL
jgi:hypothetical protein